MAGKRVFIDSSTAQNATITNRNGGTTEFFDFSTAGNAIITNNNGGATVFNDQSTAGNAVITNNFTLIFQGASTAGNAVITNNCCMSFEQNSTAGNATITNNAILTFADSSTAGNATITNNFFLTFASSSTAGNATIITNAGGPGTLFVDNSTGGNARFITQAGSGVDFSGSAGIGGVVTAGSIEGAGAYVIGGAHNTFVVGSNNLSTEVSGEIAECGCFPGALTKVGTGTLTLAATGLYSYTGPTVVAGGSLLVNGDLTSSSKVTVLPGGTLGGTGTVARNLDRGRHAVARQLDRRPSISRARSRSRRGASIASRSIGPRQI